MFKIKELPGAESPEPPPGFCSCILCVGAAVEGLSPHKHPSGSGPVFSYQYYREANKV